MFLVFGNAIVIKKQNKLIQPIYLASGGRWILNSNSGMIGIEAKQIKLKSRMRHFFVNNTFLMYDKINRPRRGDGVGGDREGGVVE